MTPQCTRILKYMQDFGSITSADAIKDLGVYRLSSRIHDMKKDGIRISTTMDSAKNRYGEKVYFSRYSIMGGD